MRNHLVEEIRKERGAAGFWPWFLQRVTGVLLVLLLAVHIWVNHFADISKIASGQQEELVLFDIVKRRLAQAPFILVDFSMLAVVLYHGLNGVRSVLQEWRPAAKRERLLTLGLIVIGVATFLYGARVLLVFALR